MLARGFIGLILIVGAVIAQECMSGSKPQIQTFGVSPSNDIQINGTFSGNKADCIWYVNGQRNVTIPATSVSKSMISCPAPSFLLSLQNDFSTGSPMPQTMRPSSRPQQGQQPRLELQVQVYNSAASKPDDKNCFSNLTLVAGNVMRPTQPPPGTYGPDCGFSGCWKTYNKSVSGSNGNITILCAAAKAYLVCLNAILKCPSKQADIDNQKQITKNFLKKNFCVPMTQAPSLGPTPSDDNDMRTRPPPPPSDKPTPMPAVSERDLAACCGESYNRSVGAQCQTLCAQTFHDLGKSGNRTLLPKLEMSCRKNMIFENCLRKRLDFPPTISTAKFRQDIQQCCQNEGSRECQAACGNFASGSARPQEIVQKCLRQGDSKVGKCFVKVVEKYYDVKLPSEKCCNNSECASPCQSAFDDFWSTGALIVTDPTKAALNREVTQLKYMISGSCSNNDVTSCLYDDDDFGDRPFFFGPSDETVQNAVVSCCNMSVARNRACQDICEQALDGDGLQSPRHIFSCFAPDESQFVQCIAKKSGGTVLDLRAFFRNLVRDQYRGDSISSCCDLATGDQCEDLCDDLATRKISPSDPTWTNTCRDNTKQAAMLTCYGNIRYGKCQPACDRLDYCGSFNNRPFSYRMGEALCGPLGDGLAAALHGSWVDNNLMVTFGQKVQLKDVNTCKPDFFKSLACFMIAKPCQDDNDLSFLCQDECVAAFQDCKSTNETLSATNICKLLGASTTKCWNLASSFSGASPAVKVINMSVSIVLPGWKWSPLFNLINSKEYGEISNQIELTIEQIFAHLPGKQIVQILGFSKSPQDYVQAKFIVLSRGTNPATFDQLKDIMEKAAGSGVGNPSLGDLPIAQGSLLIGDNTNYVGGGGDEPTSGTGITSASQAVIATLFLLAASALFH